ncbi:class I SAM-dependent methyltransferase [Candidatus Falkowbacteria bacterium]|nr:class I SAM-dependent methyltransferase [Candidatus Falkowbacteria bacterium]
MDYKDYLTQQKIETDHFWYIARKGLIQRLLASICEDKDRSRVILDIGCGTGTELPVLAEFGDVVGLDNNAEALKMVAGKGFKTLLVDMDNESLGEGLYDVVCAFDVLEHLENDQTTLDKIFKSLKPGGWLVFTVPAFGAIFSQHDRAMGHFRRYERSGIAEQLSRAGYGNARLGYWNVWVFLPVAVMRLTKKLFNRGKGRNELSTEAINLPRPLNALLLLILNSEKYLFNRKGLPFGLTIYGAAQKYEG